jgi:hypothetical protein
VLPSSDLTRVHPCCEYTGVGRIEQVHSFSPAMIHFIRFCVLLSLLSASTQLGFGAITTRLTRLQEDLQHQFWVPFPGSLTNISSISSKYEYSLANTSDGKVVAWGLSVVGEAYPPDLNQVIAVAAGFRFGLALKTDGTVVGWGENLYGQVKIPEGLVDVVAISAGLDHSLALRKDGTVVAWGSNSDGQTNVPAQLANVVKIIAADYLSIAIKRDGSVTTWGRPIVGPFASESKPMPVGLANVIGADACGLNGIVLLSDGTVQAWGADYTLVNIIPAGLNNVVAVSVSGDRAIALKSDGTVVTWGRNHVGLQVPAGLRNVVSICSGSLASAVLQSAPIINEQPTDAVLAHGAAVVLSVTLDSRTTGNFQWFKGRVEIPGANGSVLNLRNVAAADAGSYSVRITNEVGSTDSRSATVAVNGTASLVNIAARAYCSTGNNVTIGGFVISTSTVKRVLIRAVGPSLTGAGLAASEILQDPMLEVHRGASIIASNDNWGSTSDATAIANVAKQIGASPLSAGDAQSSALLLSLPAGVYSFVVSGKAGSSGIVLLEVYDADEPGSVGSFANIAARAFTTSGNGVTIGGFVIAGDISKKILMRAVGPTLIKYGIGASAVLADPKLELHDASHGNVLIATNDDWGNNSDLGLLTSTAMRIGASPLETTDTTSSALLLTLPPGVYSFVVSGKSSGTGIVLAEIYDADD